MGAPVLRVRDCGWTQTGNQPGPGAQPYPFNLEFYLILNLAIGGGFGGPVDQSLTTGTMSIDYIRFYSNDGVGQVFVR